MNGVALRLKDKVCVVTGAGAGIGRAVAVEFAREGGSVVVADIHRAGAAGTVGLIRHAGGKAAAVGVDVADPESVEALARVIGISENEIYGVASFYAQFRFQPPAEHTIHVCQGTACHVRGSHQILFDFEERLNIKAGEMTADQKFGLERVACVGCCALAPVVLVDGQVRAGMKPKFVTGLLAKLGYKPFAKAS